MTGFVLLACQAVLPVPAGVLLSLCFVFVPELLVVSAGLSAFVLESFEASLEDGGGLVRAFFGSFGDLGLSLYYIDLRKHTDALASRLGDVYEARQQCTKGSRTLVPSAMLVVSPAWALRFLS